MLILLLRDVLKYKKELGDARLLQYDMETKGDKDRCKNKKVGRQRHGHYEVTLRSIDSYLTEREAECIALMMISQEEQIIADCLEISVRTVDYYLRNAARRFECRNYLELIDLILNSDFYPKITEMGRSLLEVYYLKST